VIFWRRRRCRKKIGLSPTNPWETRNVGGTSIQDQLISWRKKLVSDSLLDLVKFMNNLASCLPPHFFRLIVFYFQRQSINNVTYCAPNTHQVSILEPCFPWRLLQIGGPSGETCIRLDGFCRIELRRQLFLPSTESWVLDTTGQCRSSSEAGYWIMDLRYSGASPVKHLNTKRIETYAKPWTSPDANVSSCRCLKNELA
jgi:hypothetical protein